MVKKKDYWIWIIGIFLIFLLFKSPPLIELDLAWKTNYKEALIENNIAQSLLLETSVFDYSNIDDSITREIEVTSLSALDAIKQTAQYVVTNIDYDENLDAFMCVESTASSVLRDGKGNCATMSMLLVGMLRKIGFAAYASEGCLSEPYTCSAIYTVYPIRKPPIPKIRDYMKRGGFMHEWIEVWIPDYGWIIADPTSGEILSRECQDYTFNKVNDNARDICVTEDYQFAQLCIEGEFR